MIYLKEPITNKIVQFQNQASIGAGFTNWTALTESEILAYELQEAKNKKLADLQANLNTALVKPVISEEAEEITLDELMQETMTGNLFYFHFKTKGTGLPITEPANLLSEIKNHTNSSHYLRYSCAIVDPVAVGGIRKGYVKIDKALASSISSHLTIRGTSMISEANLISSSISAATTIEEVNAINITFE